ncbi:hypothetical protein TL16_g06603 [Triparma laevis f. inornata]|uniref:Uncharacterized protein n=1 Tax=Triparma laevis f. inornata TaxID=1714386 RepID=A0A9W7EDP7_9STRA|nr:hypothetical protein TL16_g06603 [Triparma laevis f. inornata]
MRLSVNLLMQVSLFRSGDVFRGLFAIFKLFCEYLVFRQALKLRESIAKLPPQELSEYLCQTVLVKGVAAIGTMVFFSFETAAYLISQDSLDNGKCANTSLAAVYLSAYLALIAMLIENKSAPKIVQRETALELSSIATLKGLNWWQQPQGRLVTITMLAALYLLSELGVEGEENTMIFIV